MIRTPDGAYALVGSTLFGSEYHQDVFFVKTETLEQPPQPTSLPTPLASEDNPSYSPDQTSQASSSPTQSSPTQNPFVSNTSNDGSSENIIQIDTPQDIINIVIIIVVISVVIALVIIITKRRQMPKVPPPP